MMMQTEVDPEKADTYHATDYDPYFDPAAFDSIGFPHYTPMQASTHGGHPLALQQSGHVLYCRADGRCDVARPGSVPEQDSLWRYRAGCLSLSDGRIVYATPDGWANADGNEHTVEETERLWSLVDGVFTLADGR